MTSIHCPECSTLVSGSESNCPQCNFPISKLRGLSAAILTKNAERVAGLIQLGADVNAIDRNGRTPLMTAALIDDDEIVHMLLAAGARPEFVSKSAETALSLAKSREVERLIRRAIVVSKFQRVQTPPAPPQKIKVQEEPIVEFDHSIMLTEMPPPQVNQVFPIDVQLNEELFELQNHRVQEEPTIQFDHSIMLTEMPPPQVKQVLPIDVQLNEELFEPQSHRVFEEPVTEPVVIETQPVEEPQIEEQPIYQEPIQIDQAMKRAEGPGYFFGAIIGCGLLLLFMALTWPEMSKDPVMPTTQNVAPVKQITKQEPVQQQPAQKLEVAEEPKVLDPIPEPPVKKAVVAPKLLPKPKLIGDEEKIRLARALNSQGYSLIKQGKPGDAIPVLERSVQTFPKDTKDPYYGYALYNLGIAWRKAGRPDLAIPILEKRMKIDNQRDVVARELYATRQEAKDAGFGNFHN